MRLVRDTTMMIKKTQNINLVYVQCRPRLVTAGVGVVCSTYARMAFGPVSMCAPCIQFALISAAIYYGNEFEANFSAAIQHD